jgi:MFS family permease
MSAGANITNAPVFPGDAACGAAMVGDRYGRRLPVAIGLVLFVFGSAKCALVGNIWAMIGWRGVQAVGACAGVVLARAWCSTSTRGIARRR